MIIRDVLENEPGILPSKVLVLLFGLLSCTFPIVIVACQMKKMKERNRPRTSLSY